MCVHVDQQQPRCMVSNTTSMPDWNAASNAWTVLQVIVLLLLPCMQAKLLQQAWFMFELLGHCLARHAWLLLYLISVPKESVNCLLEGLSSSGGKANCM